MKRFLLDTGIAGEFVNRGHGVYERARKETTKGNRVGICMPVLGELAHGVEGSRSRDRNMRSLRMALPAWTIWPFDDQTAFEYGRIAAHLKRVGRPMQQVDMMVAAIALTLGRCTVVTVDTDFAAVPRLSIETWLV
jgi:tRNA(fMet)-specific endonuclease VapC